jgi:hypothetical protein
MAQSTMSYEFEWLASGALLRAKDTSVGRYLVRHPEKRHPEKMSAKMVLAPDEGAGLPVACHLRQRVVSG